MRDCSSRRNMGEILCAIRVGDTGSFTKAADLLGLSPSAVSVSIKKLEKNLGVRLFQRTTRQLTLTAEGEQFLALARDAEQSFDRAFELFSLQSDETRPSLRVSLLNAFGKTFVMPTLGEFMRETGINIELGFNDILPDLVKERFDVGLCYGMPKLNRQVSRHLCRPPMLLVASPDYLSSFGRPTTPENLFKHDIIATRHANSHVTELRLSLWEEKQPKQEFLVQPRGRVILFDQFDALLDGALCGLGIAPVPARQALPYLEARRLRVVLPRYEVRCVADDIRIVYAGGTFLPNRVKLFIAHLVAASKRHQWESFDISRLNGFGEL